MCSFLPESKNKAGTLEWNLFFTWEHCLRVPQGTVLAPPPTISGINDLPNAVNHSEHSLFADNCQTRQNKW